MNKGLDVRRRGIGTPVVHGSVTRKVELTSLYDDLARGAQTPATKLLQRNDVPASAAVAEALGVAPGTIVAHIRRVRFAEDVSMVILENYLPPEFLGIIDEDLQTQGLYELLRGRGVTMRVAKQRIGARARREPHRDRPDERNAGSAPDRGVRCGQHAHRLVEPHCLRGTGSRRPDGRF